MKTMIKTVWKIQLLLISLVLILSLSFGTSPTHALSCAPPDPEAELTPVAAMRASAYVFVGSVSNAEKSEPGEYAGDYLQTIAISDMVKGNVGGNQAILRTSATWSSPLKEDQTYIFIFNTPYEPPNDEDTQGLLQFYTPLCPGVNPQILSQDHTEYAEYLSALDEVRDNNPEPTPTPLPPNPVDNIGLDLFLNLFPLILLSLLGLLF